MSNLAVGRVWRASKAKGSELLVLLAIADWADDEGRNSWGSALKLAEKTRLTDRGVRDILHRLVAMGELVIEPNTERRQVNRGYCPRVFMHVLCAAKPEDSSGSEGDENRKNLPDEPEKISGSESARTGKDFRRGRKLTSTKPEDGRTHIRKNSQGSLSTHAQRARDGRRPHPLEEHMALFEELVALYPRKDDPTEAKRVWCQLNLPAQQAEFIVAHVRMRVRAGWVRQVGGVRWIPKLWRFLENSGWTDHGEAPALPLDTGLDGMRSVRCCDVCGTELEGRVVNGQPKYPPCSRCASASRTSPDARTEEPHA